MDEKRKVEQETRNRKVQFDFPSPEAREVFLAGDFNNWDVKANPMKKTRKGTWQASLSLKPGRYEYRIIADGNWSNDPSCPGCVPNGFGGLNCVRVVE